jgi:uncharacterized membrane protein (DUF4010 family)
MFLRVLLLVALLAPFALPALAVIAGPAVAAGSIYAALALRGDNAGGEADATTLSLRNPFDIAPALLLGALVMVVSVIGHWALDRFGDAGLVTVLGISGMLDVDSAVITASGLPPGTLSGVTAGLIFAAPMLMNTMVKAGLTVAIARGRVGWGAAMPLLLSIAAGVVGCLFVPSII